MTRIRKARIENISCYIVDESHDMKRSLYEESSQLFLSKPELKVPNDEKEFKQFEKTFPLFPRKKNI